MVLIILLIVGAGAFMGFKFGKGYFQNENRQMADQIMLLEHHSHFWSQEANKKQQLTEQITKNQINQLEASIKATLELLKTLETKNSQTMKEEDKEKIASLITNLRSGISS